MSAAPPPLPPAHAGRSPLPGGPRRSPARAFVDVLGRISVILAVLGVFYGLAQVVVSSMLPADFLQRMFALPGMDLPALPPMLQWMAGHLAWLAWATLASSVLFLLASWGVLKRKEAGRLGFIFFMVLATLLNFVGMAVVMQMMEWMSGFGAAIGDPQFEAQMRASNAMSVGMGLVSAVLFVALHGWIVYKLCTREVRAVFDGGA